MVWLMCYGWMLVCILWWVLFGEVSASFPDDLLTITVLMTLQYSLMLLFIISAAHLYHTVLSHPVRGIVSIGSWLT